MRLIEQISCLLVCKPCAPSQGFSHGCTNPEGAGALRRQNPPRNPDCTPARYRVNTPPISFPDAPHCGTPDAAVTLLEPVAQALDGLGVALCLFDDADTTLLWNRNFLRFFPEHASHVRVGEPYALNLRRFYEHRLDTREMPLIERYIAEGLVRHRAQQRPFVFEHRGRRLCVASLPMPGVGRVRLWKEEAAEGSEVISVFGGLPGAPEVDGAVLFDHVPDGVMVTGSDNRILWVNEPFVAMYGLANRQAALGLRFDEAYRRTWEGLRADAPYTDRALFEEGLTILEESMRFAGAPFELPLPGARWSRVIAQRGPDGKGVFAHVDISVLKRQQHQLVEAERRARDSETLLRQKSALLEATLDRMEQGIVMVNADRVVEVCNRRAMELLDLPEALMMSRPHFQQVLDHQSAQGEFAETPSDVMAFIQAGGILDTTQRYERRRPDGRVIEIFSVPMEGGGVVRTYTDISSRRRDEERIRHLARHDGLTSLFKREVFLEHLAAAVAGTQQGGEPFAVHYIDIDNFKPINDRFGHAVGDKVLVLVADAMRRTASHGEVLARLGGDEFAVLQYRTAEPSAARALAECILSALAEPMQIEGNALALGASIGIAIHVPGEDDPDLLMRRADSAMYAVKAQGAPGIRIFEG
ncbi:MAG: diguanylate cyclase [Variovorax sp.]|uniref:Diguanylate cyclase n=1 Tax=Variovorax guangxiensis TaxID=1775474 RepID=A0A502DZA8_9BURK|nr:MAG: diguanylate cyclase [Variovorax sp.]TPG26274.1 diguanylate cyclase [Variovorax ginsengisoli]TPG29999.1 diguanylate cyclase [Variovorax guangxiensis]